MRTSTKRKAISKKVKVSVAEGDTYTPGVGLHWGKAISNKEELNKVIIEHTKRISKKDYTLIDLDNRYHEGYQAGIDDCESCHADSIEVPDSQATVEQIKNAAKWLNTSVEVNYWKYACVAILLGLVAGMILSTPLFVKLAEVCSQ
jgi:hypothetical protein